MKRILFIVFLLFVFSIYGCKPEENENVNNIINLIEELPNVNEITLDHEEIIMDIEFRYSVLTEEEKLLVTNYQKMFEIKNRIQYLNDFQKETVNEINNLQNISNQGLEYYLDCDKIFGRLVVRSREAGDRISLKSRGCTKSLKKLFNELEISPEKRNTIAVFADEKGVVLVEGAGCDSRTAVTKTTERIMVVRIKKSGV